MMRIQELPVMTFLFKNSMLIDPLKHKIFTEDTILLEASSEYVRSFIFISKPSDKYSFLKSKCSNYARAVQRSLCSTK
jgi:hypothetical protein